MADKGPAKSREAMVRGMAPRLDGRGFAFVTFEAEPPEALAGNAIAWFREDEGISLIVPAEMAPGEPLMRLITLTVHSSLEGVGLTAAVSGALAEAGIACNMVAAFHHDHVFVPGRDAERALNVLRHLAEAG